MNEDLNKKIAKDFGLENMNPEEQERMVEKIGNLLFESVIERSMDAMNEKTMSDFDSVITEAGDDYPKVLSFLKTNVPGFGSIVAEEMKRLKRATSGIFA